MGRAILRPGPIVIRLLGGASARRGPTLHSGRPARHVPQHAWTTARFARTLTARSILLAGVTAVVVFASPAWAAPNSKAVAAVRATLTKLEIAAWHDDGHLGCAQLTPTLKRKFVAIATAASEQPTCANGFVRLFAPFGKTETLAQAQSFAANAQITIQGKTAIVQNSPMRFRHLKGKWLASRLS